MDSINFNSKHHRVIVCGASSSGKTTIIEQILKQSYKNFGLILIFSNTELYTPRYVNLEFDNKRVLHYDTFKDKIESFIEIQKSWFKDNKHKMLMVFDDVVSGKNLKNPTGAINDLLFNSRNFGVSFILSTQYLSYIAPEIRNNCDFIIGKRMFDINEIERYNRIFFPEFKNHDVMKYWKANIYATLLRDVNLQRTYII